MVLTSERRVAGDTVSDGGMVSGTDNMQYYVYGAGGHAHVVIDVLRNQGITVRGIFDDYPANRHPLHKGVQPGIRITGPLEFPHLDAPVILCVGRNGERAELVHLLNATYGIARHSTAIVAESATIGEGTVILHGSIIQPNSRIGRHVLVNTAASIDHDNIIGDFAHISPHVTLCGHVEVGEGTHVGAGAIVIPKTKIGKWSTVGAGAVVLHDVPDHVTVVGNPARILESASGQVLPRFD
jgi:sugar O-acyltransferase (sialic acid O-acetyltransferase NeuD family)